jgi:hypothetical protein
MIDPRDALDLTIKMFNLKASEIARKAELDKAVLSRYRHKKQDLYGLTVAAIIRALPTDARKFYCDLVLTESKEMLVSIAKDSGSEYSVTAH